MKLEVEQQIKAGEEFYIVNDAQTQREYIETRTAAKWVGFFLPHLRSGMNLLDCGCGVGSITLDLAQLVAPGQVVGIDVDPDQLERASSQAQRKRMTNVRFEVASAYNLPFPDNSFDAVLAHTLLIHLSDPLRALKEMRRVLKPGGIVAVADDDFGTRVLTPPSQLMEEAFALFANIIRHNGGNPYYSRRLRRLLLDAGFARTEGHAVAAEYYGHQEETQNFALFMERLFRNPILFEQIIRQGLADQEFLDAIVAEMQSWAQKPDAFVAWMYCAALGWRTEETS